MARPGLEPGAPGAPPSTPTRPCRQAAQTARDAAAPDDVCVQRGSRHRHEHRKQAAARRTAAGPAAARCLIGEPSSTRRHPAVAPEFLARSLVAPIESVRFLNRSALTARSPSPRRSSPAPPTTSPSRPTPAARTVSGLSGTVVLQDNRGDDLSVSGNGPFTPDCRRPAGSRPRHLAIRRTADALDRQPLHAGDQARVVGRMLRRRLGAEAPRQEQHKAKATALPRTAASGLTWRSERRISCPGLVP
jgi:hypothetical protein